MKTPDEIKKGLECCVIGPSAHQPKCVECPYKLVNNCSDELLKDTAGLVKQKERDNAEQAEIIQQLEAERDAAVADIRLAFTSHVGACETCKHVENQIECDNPLGCGYCGDEKCKCNSCDNDYSNWQWRGVQKEDGNA